MTQVFSDILLIFIFVVINGFFAASEIAIVTVRQSRIKQLIEEGSQRARILLKLREEPNRFLATIQIGVTMAGAIASAIGGAVAVQTLKPELQKIYIMAPYAEFIAIGLVVFFITYISLIFGELIPKSLAMGYSESIALFTSPIVEKISKIANLPVKLLTQSTNILLKPFGKKAFSDRGFISEEEVKLLLEEGGQQGVFEEQEKELIHSVFEFKDTFVKEVMSPATQMVTIGFNMSAETVKNIILEEKFSRYPVIGKDINDIRGILYAKDFFNLISKSDDVSIHKLIKAPYFVPETMKISNLLKEMQKKRMHMAIVIDEYGAVTGLVTLEDLLEEIVGEIRDEYDTDSPVI
ncbi:MAG: hemolysin family protein, partial [Thermodesulfovibrionales bacterium]|nr:hemolysin family protein [Thermodesulfovibrionales bacterium]